MKTRNRVKEAWESFVGVAVLVVCMGVLYLVVIHPDAVLALLITATGLLIVVSAISKFVHWRAERLSR